MKKGLIYRLPLLLLAVLMVTGCTKYFDPESTFEEYEQEEVKTVKRKVLLISVDGLVGYELQKNIPTNIGKLMETAKYSFDALTDAQTADAPAWATMMTGYSSSVHNVLDESYLPSPNTNDPHGEVNFAPSFIYRLEDQRPTLRTSVIVQDEGLANILLMDADNNVIADSDAKVKDEAVAMLQADVVPDLLVLQFREVLEAGVASSFSAEETAYAQAIESVDAKIGEIVQTLESREDSEYENWLIIVTSSHGGIENSYGGSTFPERNVFSLYAQKDFSSQEVKASTMQYAFLNGYFPGTYNQYDFANNGRTRTFTEMGVRAQSPAGAESNVFNANSTPTGSITYDFKFRLREDNEWAGLPFTGGYAYWYNYFMGKDNSSNSANAGWHLFGNNANFTLRFQDGTNTAEVANFSRGMDGEWHHYSFIFEKVTNTSTRVRVYLDGVLGANQVINMGVDAFANEEPLTLGFNNQRTDLGYAHYDLADFRVWKRALTEAEARQIGCEQVLEENHSLYNDLLAYYNDLSTEGWYNSLDNNVPDLTFSNRASVNIAGNYMPCEQPKDEIFIQNLDIAQQVFYWLGMKPHEEWGLQGEVFLSKFELEFLK